MLHRNNRLVILDEEEKIETNSHTKMKPNFLLNDELD